MTPLELANIQNNAAKKERLTIAGNLRALAIHGREEAKKTGRDASAIEILDHIADQIERGEFSK